MRADGVQEELSTLCPMTSAWIWRKQRSTTTVPAIMSGIRAILQCCSNWTINLKGFRISINARPVVPYLDCWSDHVPGCRVLEWIVDDVTCCMSRLTKRPAIHPLNNHRLAGLPLALSATARSHNRHVFTSKILPPQPRNTRSFWLGGTSRTPTNDTLTLTSHNPICGCSSRYCSLSHPIRSAPILHPNCQPKIL